MPFRATPPEPEFVAVDREVLEHWARHRVFERSITEREGCPEWVFFEGPPTANGRPGLHHVWARVYKDLFCRYHTMKGEKVVRRAGWDTHGLPVEVQVEKELGFAGKRDIEDFGVAAFVERCRASVSVYVEEFERLTERIGFWVDTADAYWTLDRDYVQSVWWHLQQLWDRGLLFEDVKVVPYCPRCETALSSHELGQPDVYQEVDDPSVYVRLPVEGDDGIASLLVWTTTPWTLPSNTGVAVHPELEYVVVDGAVVAAARADAVLGEGARDRATAHLRGQDLVGMRYRRPLDVVPVPPVVDGWRVVGADFVTVEEGTGLVHLAPAFGADDFAVAKGAGLPTLNPVGPDGRFTSDAGWLADRAVRDANAEIVAELANRGLLLRAETHRHSYPHCWRCATPLLYWGTPSWYVATSARRHDLVAANDTVNWRPEHIKRGRFGEWLANNVDWALSRNRYWGTPLPMWRCAQGHTRCVASLSELSELAGRDVSDIDPHRPAIDEVSFACPDCGNEAHRVEPVIDAWFDSGAMPAAQWGFPHAPGSRARFRLPADYIAEAIDQTRGWFYSLLAVNLLVHGQKPYENVLCLGLIVDAEGRKMSTRLGNVVDPWTILDTRGADPLRWWMFRQGSPWTATRVSVEAIDRATSETLVTLWSAVSFFTTYANLNGFDHTDPQIPPTTDRPALDRWARSRVHATIAAVTEAFDGYWPLQAVEAIASLVDDLSNWYVRRSRRRFWRTSPTTDPTDSLAAQATLCEALTTVAILLAPACPFVGEWAWRTLADVEPADSVHLAPWPTVDHDALDRRLETSMALTRRLVSLGRAARAQAGIKVRQPLKRALVVLAHGGAELLADLVADDLNVDEVVVVDQLADVMSFTLVPNFRRLGARLGHKVQRLRAALAELDAAEAAEALAAGRSLSVSVDVDGAPIVLRADDIEVRVTGREGFAVSRQGTEAVALDLEIDEDLRVRGLLREVLRQVQELRRARGFALSDRIRLDLTGVPELEPFAADIGQEVLAMEVGFDRAHRAGGGHRGHGGHPIEVDDGRTVTAWIEPA